MKWFNLFMVLVFIVGLSLVVIYSSWQVALGIFLLPWFNNWELSDKYIKK